MKVAVSIVSFNSKDYLRDCLEDLENQSFKNSLEIWVIDNNSGDGSVEMIKKNFPKIKLIEEKDNLGFAKAQNIVLKKASADYYLLLNPDTRIPKNAISEMVDFMEKNDADIAAPKIENFSGKINSNGGDLPFGLPLLSWLFNLESLGIKKNFHREDGDFYKTLGDKGWVGGTFMMIKKDVLEKIGYLSSDYFMYVEDVEFCYRAKKAGFKIMINPDLTIKHKSGGSSDNPSAFQWENEFKNLLMFYQKNTNGIQTAILRILIYISLVLRIIAYTLLGKGGVSSTYAKIITKI